eukprot:3758475-Amphidinium_carterae.1
MSRLVVVARTHDLAPTRFRKPYQDFGRGAKGDHRTTVRMCADEAGRAATGSRVEGWQQDLASGVMEWTHCSRKAKTFGVSMRV